MANAIKNIAKYIRKNPDAEESTILRNLCMAVEKKEPFVIDEIFDMKAKAFELALKLLDDWRFDRHIADRRLQKYLDAPDD